MLESEVSSKCHPILNIYVTNNFRVVQTQKRACHMEAIKRNKNLSQGVYMYKIWLTTEQRVGMEVENKRNAAQLLARPQTRMYYL